MKYISAASLVYTSVLATTAWAQGPLFDRVSVDFANDVHVNDTVIPAGHYQIQQLQNLGGATRILFVTQGTGTRYVASGATIPLLDNLTSQETRVILEHIGQNYYLNKIWIEGKDYGYEFPLPAEAKAAMQERVESLTLAGTYRVPQVVAEAVPPPPPPPRQPEPAPAPPPPPPAPEPAPAPAPAPEPPPAPELPKTADNWAMVVILGATLASAGLALRKK